MPLDAALDHLTQRVPRSPEPWDALRSLGPLLAAHPAALDRLSPPAAVRARWARDRRATLAATVVLAAELARVLSALRDAGIDALVYKGAAALEGLYPEPGLRPMDDADLLVRLQDRERAVALLARLGFTPRPLDDGRLGTSGQAVHGARAFRRRLGALDVELDLHWHWISDARLRAAFPRAEDRVLWRRARPTSLGGVAAMALDPVDAAIVTAASQLFGHPWSHPLGYVDLHLLVSDFTPEDWSVLVDRARARGLAAPVYWGLRFAHELFGSPTGAAASDLRPGAVPLRLGERLVGVDWLGVTGGRGEQPARDLFVLLTAGPRGALRLVRASLFDRGADPRSTARTALWLTQAALAASRRG